MNLESVQCDLSHYSHFIHPPHASLHLLERKILKQIVNILQRASLTGKDNAIIISNKI